MSFFDKINNYLIVNAIKVIMHCNKACTACVHLSASVHQGAKLVAALLGVAEVTAGLEESNDILPPGL